MFSINGIVVYSVQYASSMLLYIADMLNCQKLVE